VDKLVQHHMDLLTGVGPDGIAKELQEPWPGAFGVAVRGHPSRAHVQGGEQVGDAMALVVVGALLRDAEVQRQQRLADGPWLGSGSTGEPACT
jgi:hypothetical protein